ncbi:hypothetical protein QVZ41_03185 [Wenyingzhuangia sp. chi5]|uniref:Cytochrome c domain-containing protein n=1 Tax=Wenyingzhuangia gilva TaxID=3057677 RepID=A0ABT8VPF2_9FLAO|nr:hypothetical protein [Wenyingzhuangia sp. chi5]MDO3693851.1 hypothetical protein [Wenyingzhuangia sp. chi5]
MKKIFALSIFTLFLVSCSNDSESDLMEKAPDNNENPIDTSGKVTFTKDILPLIQSKCSSCHVSGGSESNYTVYNTARNSASTIVNRINRTQGSGGFMPEGRSKLSTAELALFDQWITDGKLE